MQKSRPTSSPSAAPLAACVALLGFSLQARGQVSWEYTAIDGLVLGSLLLLAAFGRRRAGR